jgi:hypothetical protein
MFSLRFARLRHADFSRYVSAAFDFSPRYAAPLGLLMMLLRATRYACRSTHCYARRRYRAICYAAQRFARCCFRCYIHGWFSIAAFQDIFAAISLFHFRFTSSASAQRVFERDFFDMPLQMLPLTLFQITFCFVACAPMPRHA